MVKIIQGGRKVFTVKLKSEANDGDPLNLTGVTEITTCFLNGDNTELMLSLTGGAITVLDAILGKIQITLTAAQTAALAVVDTAVLELAIDYGAGPLKSQIEDAYAVLATVC